jgi:CBS domain-containing protein
MKTQVLPTLTGTKIHAPELLANSIIPRGWAILKLKVKNIMNASDIMVRKVITTDPQASVSQVAKQLVDNDISALPVVDDTGRVVGIISEADLMRREELGSEKIRPWWLEAMIPAVTLAEEFAQSHGKRVEELMSNHVVTATEDASLGEIASLLEKHHIKRVPILKDGNLVGVVSRSNLVQALASAKTEVVTAGQSDHMLRAEIVARLAEQQWTDFGERNVIVVNGVANLWGLVGSPSERKALVALVEEVPGVTEVRDEMIPAYQ